MKAIKRKKASTIRVPEDCKTLNEAVKKVQQDPTLTTIVLGKGKHKLKKEKGQRILPITSSVNIIGDPHFSKKEIVVVGGIFFGKEIPGNCHLQHLTLRQAKHSAVAGWSSFTMKDVLVERCGWHGVFAYGTGTVGRCTNVEVRHCGKCGVVAAGAASITLIGSKTSVHHNNSRGLAVIGSSSEILVVLPLNK